MTKTIAFAGKGGTGKTTIAALLLHTLTPKVRGPMLAIDADPASNLHLALGYPMPSTVGEIREAMTKAAQSGELGVSISRHDYLDREVRLAIEEGQKMDLIAMGRPEGPGCYCAFNHMLREILDTIGRSYEYVVIDNEAGMEHISRRTTRDVNLLVLVTDPTIRGVRTAAGMIDLAKEVDVNVKDIMLVVNRVAGELPQPLQEAIDELDVGITAMIPTDENVNRLDALGQPLVNLNGNSPTFQAVENLTVKIIDSL
jgi:CO dehydrogenase maturation factor